jgi:UDP-N-acetylmuramoyl-tripeptide--D-alanyl-D-alanine ligase
VLVTPRGEVAIDLPMPGRHNVRNALAAAAMALGAGATLEQVRDGLNGVQRDFVVAEFAHVAEYQPSLAAARRQRVDRRIQRPRVGVVAVVDQHRAVAQAMRDKSARHRLHAGVRVLVKGSRGSAMDRIVQALLASDAAAGKGEADAA